MGRESASKRCHTWRHLERRPPVSGRERGTGCHPERSEGSLRQAREILHCAQDDRWRAGQPELCTPASMITVQADFILVGRRHDDPSLHPQESVSNINVREDARFRECHSEAVVATAIGRVEHARVQEARAVIAGRVPTWTTFVPIGDRRKGLPGEKRYSMDLVDRVVGPDHRVSNPHVDVSREIAHDCRVVEDHIAACR